MRPDYPKGRPLCAYIDTRAFKHNIQRVEALAPKAQAVIVIKADAYGHGLVPMAKAAGDRDLAVATSNEAKELIEAGISNRIWILEGPFSQDCLALSELHEVLWVLHSDWQIALIEANASEAHFNCWVKADTGMHRLGFSKEEFIDAIARISVAANMSMFGYMTHFASSDVPANDSVHSQFDDFNGLVSSLGKEYLPLSLANSGAVLYYPEAHQNWVRPGIMLYGGMPDPSQSAQQQGLKPVMHFVSKVISLKTIAVGESVGYGAKWTANEATTVAIVACGYGDGYPRHAPNGTPVWVKDRRVELIGRVSMDMLAVNVTLVPDIQVGDAVELWGEHIAVDEVALASGTISYELLTGVTKRVPRRYLS